MTDGQVPKSRPWVVQEFVSVGSRAAARTLRPFRPALGAAAGAGFDLGERTLERAMESQELERILTSALANEHLQETLRRTLSGDGARELVDTLFETGLIDHLLERLLASPALWRVIDEVAGSPSVTAAISRQGLGFADQLGAELRSRSRQADVRIERLGRRIARRGAQNPASSVSDDDPPPRMSHRSA